MGWTMRFLTLYLLLLVPAATIAGAEKSVQLATSGPITTPAAARDAAVAQKANRIEVADGIYALAEVLQLKAEHSGITWEAAPGARPVFSGGRRIGGWQKLPDGLWRAVIPEVRDGGWYFEQLWVGGQRRTRARTPNKGFFHMQSHATTEHFPGQDAAALGFHSFVVRPGEFAELAKARPQEMPDVTVIIPHTWEVHRYRIAQQHAAGHALRLTGPKIWELLVHEPDGRYWIENFRAALDAPGEWFLSRAGELFYHPFPGEDLTRTEVTAPVLKRLVSVDGARDVTFRGIHFSHTQYLTPAEGRGAPQAAVDIGAAIEADRAQNVRVENGAISHTAGYGVWFRRGCQDCAVRHCHLHDLGGGGVRIGEHGGLPEPEDATGHCVVDDCIIQHGGRLFPAAVGFLVGHSGGNALTNCDIGDFLYSSVSLGWVWGYTESPAKRNRVENNHLHHLGWGFISDMGGVYTLGPSEGTVVRGNHIHHVSSYRYGGWGLYTDEGSSGILLENNLVHDTSESCFHQHYGYDNYVRNNILAFGGRAMLQRTRNEDRISFVFENNILTWRGGRLLDGSKYNWDSRFFVMRRNVYWQLDGAKFDFAGAWDWDAWRKSGRDAHSVIADPLFFDVAARDFRIKPESPALKLGFKPWDLGLAGVRTDGPDGAAWRALAAQGADFPNWEAESRPWPAPAFCLPLETFEFSAVGSCTLPRHTRHREGKGDDLAVSEEAASPLPLNAQPTGRRSLRFLDAPGLKNTWDPHLVITPNWNEGKVTVTFDAMAQPGADWYAEWRDEGGGYHVGPSVWWRNGKILTGPGGQSPFLDLPADQWARFEITAGVGSQASGKWSLAVKTQAGQEKRLDNLACDPQWKSFAWLGWTSLAESKTAWFLDNLSASNNP